jgi:hypothetical protein
MILKTGLFALIAMNAMVSAALADCRIVAFRFFPAQNDSVSTTGVSTGGRPCVTQFYSGSYYILTSAAVASRPSNGTLSQVGTLRLTYKPKAGFKGVDRYAIRICGTGGGGSGCSTIAYSITVE